MNKSSLGVLSVVLLTLPVTGLAAQGVWVPAAEIIGQPIQVETNGVTNTVILDPGGAARIMTPGGQTVPASWSASAGQLCLYSPQAKECWPYQAPFQAGQPVLLTSSCAASSRWLASATKPMPAPPTQHVYRPRQG